MNSNNIKLAIQWVNKATSGMPEQQIRESLTLHDLIITTLKQMKPSCISKYIYPARFKYEKLLAGANISLDKVTHDTLLSIIKENFINTVADRMRREVVRHFILGGLKKGLPIPCYQNNLYSFGSYLAAINPNYSKLKTVQDLITYYIPKLGDKKGNYLGLGISSIIEVLAAIGDKNFTEIEDSHLMDIVSISKSQRLNIKKSFFYPAQRDGFLSNAAFTPLLKQIEIHTKNRSKIQKQHRTAGWYLCELYLNATKSKKKSSYEGQEVWLWNNYSKIWNIPANELTSNHLKHLNKTKTDFITLLLENNSVKEEAIMIDEKNEKKCLFENDKWHLIGRNSRTIDFNFIQNKYLKLAIKSYAWNVVISSKRLNKRRTVTNLKIFLEFAKKNKINQLKEFDNKKKDAFYDYLDKKLLIGATPSSLHSCLKELRSLILFLQKSGFNDVSTELKFNKGEYMVEKKAKATKTIYTDAEIRKIIHIAKTDENRFDAIMLGIQALTGKRSGEMQQLKTNCLFNIAGIPHLRWLNNKTNKEMTVPLALLAGNRTDISPTEIENLMKIFVDEILCITSDYRSLAPEHEKDTLFIVKKFSVSRKKLAGRLESTGHHVRMAKIRKKYSLSKLQLHTFRHTIITKLIRSGSSMEIAARAIGDTIDTVKNYYEGELTRIETLKLGRKQLVEPIEDAKAQIDKRRLSKVVVINPSAESKIFGMGVSGGICSAQSSETQTCPSFLKLWGEHGCKGCSSLVVTPENKTFWKNTYIKDNLNLKKSRGTILHKKMLDELKKTEWILNRIEEVSNHE